MHQDLSSLEAAETSSLREPCSHYIDPWLRSGVLIVLPFCLADFAHMRQREEEMRDTNESTANRVLYSSMIGMLCLMGLVVWQILYLRKFFKSKKLID